MKEGRNKSWEDCGKELYTFFKESLGIEEEQSLGGNTD